MPGMRMPSQAAAAIKLANSTPAGDISMPSPDMQMMPGMRMASSTPCVATPSAAQQQAAVRFVDTSWQGAKKYRSLAAAQAAGYRAITPRGAPVVHYLNPAYYRATVRGGPVLNAGAPQSLVYANTPKGAVLVAAMYITTPGGPTPQPGGCLTQWHVHTNLCLAPGLDVVGAIGPGQPNCPAGLGEPGHPGHDPRLVRAHPRRPNRGRRARPAGGAGRRAGAHAAERHRLTGGPAKGIRDEQHAR